MVGLFINTLPVRARVWPDASTLHWMKKLQAEQAEAREYEYSPMMEIQKWSDLPASAPLFHSIVVFENFFTMFADEPDPGEQGQTEGETDFSDLKLPARTNYPLSLMAIPGEELRLWFYYQQQRFEPAAIERMAGHLRTVLEGITANPRQRLGDLPLLTAAEHRQILKEWNATGKEWADERSLVELFEAQAAAGAEATAIICEEERLSYEELNRRANQVAHYLRGLGVGPEVVTGVCLERGVALVVALLGVLKAGGVYLPLDPSYPRERLEFMLADAGAAVLWTEQRWAGMFGDSRAQIVCADEIEASVESGSLANPAGETRPEQAAYVIYTSGSTGRPKGVVVEHKQVLNRLAWMWEAYPFGAGEVCCQKTALNFVDSIWELLGGLLQGVPTVILADEEVKDPYALVERLAGERVSRIWVVPSLLRMLLEEHGDLQQRLPALKFWVSSGEALTVELLERFQRAMPESVLYNVYGTSEVWDATWYDPSTAGEKEKRVPIGRPISNVEVYVLDGEGRVAPIGVPGELHVGGVGLARGYIGLAELTGAKFIAHPFSTEAGARLYKTGDLVRYRGDGNLEFLGRMDHQVKIRGFRVELGEVEAALVEHPNVRQAVVTAHVNGDAHMRLLAYVVANGMADASAPDLRAFLQRRLPEYMLPSVFVPMDSFPLTSNGKIDRHALPEPGEVEREVRQRFEPPGSPAEKLLVGIWADVLKVKRVGIHDNFFELGGDSILSLQIISRANQAGLRLTPRQIFEHQTIAELAVQIEPPPAMREAGTPGLVPLTATQRWFFEQDLPEPHHYNQSILFEVPRSLEAGKTATVLDHLLSHHDALRLRFRRDELGWEQTMDEPAGPISLSTYDLSGLAEAEQRAEIERIGGELQASLNLSDGPLLRAGLFDLGRGRTSRLLLVAHHLVIDGVSWRILLEDFETAYGQLAAGEEIVLPAKTTSFQHWAERLSQYAQSAAVEQEAGYWLELAKAEAQPLPRDMDGENTVASAASVMVRLNTAQTRELLQEVPKAYHTQINDVLLTALVQAFERWTGKRSLLLDLEGHGREGFFGEVDVSRTVGWFTAIFPVNVELGERTEAGEVLKGVKEQLRRIPHGGVGYGLLRYVRGEAEVEEKLRALPRPEVAFNYLDQFENGKSVDRSASPRGLRPYLIEIDGSVDAGRLEVKWSYSEGIHRRSTIEGLASGFLEALESLITHCGVAETAVYSPSDFSASNVSQGELERLISKIGSSEEEWLEPEAG